MHAVHVCGFVHRDLKPRNVVFMADGVPKITDFGLAKLLDAADGPTKSIEIMGTAPYMAPEQAEGRSRHVTAATDVYALGAILYECLTRQPPFQASTTEETLQLVRFKEPKPPSRIRPEMSKALEDICLKCLEKKPSWRHRSAAELADRLQSYLDGKERPKHWYQRAGWAIRRHAGTAACVAIGFILAATVWGGIYWRDPARAAERIEAQLEANKAVTLIEDTGGPKYGRWVMGQEFSQLNADRHAPFAIHSDNLALYDLVRDPKLKRFRIRAQAQHNRDLQTDGIGYVGIYVARTGYASQGGISQHAVLFQFNDIVDDRNSYDKAVRNVPLPLRWKRPQANSTSLRAMLFADFRPLESLSDCLASTAAELFEPAGIEPGGTFAGKWRNLRMDVTPEQISAYWEDTPAGTLTAEQLGPKSRARIEQLRDQINDPEGAFRNGFDLEYTPQGSVGLCVFGGTASFRRVVLEPLSP
jgi:serine/threonine-protein kinase